MTLDMFVTEEFLQSLFRSLSGSFVPVIQEILCVPSVPWAQVERNLAFHRSVLFRYLEVESLWDVYQLLLPEIFLLGSLVNEDQEDSSGVSYKCLDIWSRFFTQSPHDLLMLVKSKLCVRLQFHVRSVSSWSR
jgi:hypothetical protein